MGKYYTSYHQHGKILISGMDTNHIKNAINLLKEEHFNRKLSKSKLPYWVKIKKRKIMELCDLNIELKKRERIIKNKIN